MNHIITDNRNAIDFHNSNLIKIDHLLEPLSEFFVKNIIYTELVPEENKAFFLSNTPGVMEKFLELGQFSNDFYFALEHTKINDTCHTFIWPPNSIDPITMMLKSMKLTGGFTIVQKTKTLIKTWAFADDSDNGKLINLFVNEPNIFYHFIKYFDVQIKESLFCQKNTCLASFKTPQNNILKEKNEELTNKINLFKKNTAIGRHYLYDNTNIYITDKELQCLFQLSIGKTHKEIGKALDISPKTVRCHIDAVKSKTNIDCKHTLINTLLKMNLFAYADL
jgi:DNA-binding CsgD family transcriptional regulator